MPVKPNIQQWKQANPGILLVNQPSQISKLPVHWVTLS